VPIKDLARSDVVTARPETPVIDIVDTMETEDVGSVVITEGDTAVGIITDRDLTLRSLGKKADPTEQPVKDVMTSDLITIDRDAGFYEATRLMSEYGIRRLPVREENDLVGIVTADDLTELIADEKQQLAAVLQAQRPEY
jgi:CBS domain-containing protein